MKSETENKQIGYKDLTIPLKIAVVMAWTVGLIYLMSFLIGFIAGVMEGLVV
jgi:hypothetical protein